MTVDLTELNTPELLRVVDRSNPEVRELARRMEESTRYLEKSYNYHPYDLVDNLRRIAGL